MTLAWSQAEYVALEPGDLDPEPAPTDAQRIRVAAAVATMIRDRNILGQRHPVGPTAETIRAILIMNEEAWARDIGAMREFVCAYDPTDPRERIQQAMRKPVGG